MVAEYELSVAEEGGCSTEEGQMIVDWLAATWMDLPVALESLFVLVSQWLLYAVKAIPFE